MEDKTNRPGGFPAHKCGKAGDGPAPTREKRLKKEAAGEPKASSEPQEPKRGS